MSLCQCGCGQPTPIATRNRYERGVRKGEPMRFLHLHHHGYGKPEKWIVEDRGYETPCWVWQRALTPDGYGIWGTGRAHRVSYERAYGPVPEGLQLDHLCRIRACCNPDHLEPVTSAENRRRSPICTKLTPEQVGAIRASRADRKVLGARYGVTPELIHMIRRGKCWRGVEAISTEGDDAA